MISEFKNFCKNKNYQINDNQINTIKKLNTLSFKKKIFFLLVFLKKNLDFTYSEM